jgi:hypothetical protein
VPLYSGPVGIPDRQDGRTAEADQKPTGQVDSDGESESTESADVSVVKQPHHVVAAGQQAAGSPENASAATDPGTADTPAVTADTAVAFAMSDTTSAPPTVAGAAKATALDPAASAGAATAGSGDPSASASDSETSAAAPAAGAAAAADGGSAAAAGGSAAAAAAADGASAASAKSGAARLAGLAGVVGLLPRAGAGVARASRRLGRVIPPGLRRAARRRSPEANQEDVAASALARLTTLPVLLIMAWLLPGLPLLMAGDFIPVPMLLISAPLLVALVANGLRVVPSRWPRVIPGRARDRGWASWFGLMATVAVAAGFAAWQLVEHSESVIVIRDQGAYLQAGYWLAQHGALPISQSLHAFGGAHPGLGFASIGFFAHGTSVVPSFTSGLPLLLAGGFWAQGVAGAAAIGPVLGGFAILSFGGLVARLAGPQWAPAGAIVLGLTLPEQYVARSSLAETALQVLLFGALCLLIDALTLRGAPLIAAPAPAIAGAPGAGAPGSGAPGAGAAAAGAPGAGEALADEALAGEPTTAVLPAVGWRRLGLAQTWSGWGRWVSVRTWSAWLTPERILAGLAGLALGLGVLVSLSSLVYLLPVIPFAGLLIVARRAAAAPFCMGLVVGVGYGLADGYVLSRPFLDSVSHPMELVAIVAVWLAALTIATVQLLRVPGMRRWLRRLAARRPITGLPVLGGLLAVAVLVGFAVRPYFQTVHGTPGAVGFRFIAILQRLQGLPLDPTRTYAEDTLYWVIWYIGLPTVLLGGFGVALLVRQCLRALLTWSDPARAWRNWALPLGIIGAGSIAVLWQPGIVPDQPWASRRLVVVVLPGLILCALWAAVWLTGHARERGARTVTASVAGVFCVAALVVPTVATTFGAGLTHGGQTGGLRPTAVGMAFKRINAGELTAVEQLCATIRRDSSVVIVDRRVAQRFTQVIRGMCAVPTAWMVGQPGTAVSSVLSEIEAAGRHPVLLGSRPGQLTAFGGSPVKVLDLQTTQDAHDLTSPPTEPATIHFVIWMLIPQSGAVGT